ncbi:MAG: gluconolaconase, partial [Vicinamibacterales bacterium]
MSARLYASFFALLLATSSSAAFQDLGGTLLVANRNGGSISLFDLATGVEMARVPIGPAIPHEVAVSPDGRLALTGEYGPNDRPGRHVVVIDVAEGRLVGRIDLGPKTRPHSVVFMPDGRRAVVTLEQSDRIALVDVVDRTVLRTYPTGGREGHMVRLSPDGARAFVTSRGAEGTLSIISLAGETPPVVIPTGAGAEGLAVTPDGREVWVVNRIARSISIVDTRSLDVIQTIDVPPDARRAEISAVGRVLVPHGGTDAAPAQYLSVYDLRSRA